MTVFGSIIRDRRLALGLSKSAAASKAGVDRGTWHDIESGRRPRVLPATLARVEQALEVKPGQLQELAQPVPFDDVVDADERRLRQRVLGYALVLPKDQLREMLRLVESLLR